jgi:hypothetical protein
MEEHKQTETEKERQVNSKVKSLLIIFFDLMETVHKECIMADQRANCAYYCDILW